MARRSVRNVSSNDCQALLNCPFCGSEGKLKVADGILDDFTMFYCYCPNGKCIAGGTDWFRSREEAIEAWNTRAERTCKFVADSMNTAFDEDGNEIETGEVDRDADMYCGNCGYPMMRDECNGWWDEEKGPYGGYFLKPRFNCCPKCGSRVTDWDGRKVES